MRSAPWRAVPLTLVLALALVSCNGPNRGTNTNPSAAGGFTVVVTASPNTLRAAPPGAAGAAAGGGDCAIIQAKVFDTKGQLVDGALVTFAIGNGVFTGGVNTATTVRGIAAVNFCAGTRPGTNIVTASVEDAFATTTITVF